MLDFLKVQRIFYESDITIQKFLLFEEISRNLESFAPTWHPLGFIHAKIADSNNSDTFRLHIWPSSTKAVKLQAHRIHDHRFDVESCVLKGSVENREYRLTSSQKPDCRVLRVNYNGPFPRIYEENTQGLLVKESTKVISAGSRYIIKKKVLHETNLLSEITAVTLVKTSSTDIYDPKIIVPIFSTIPEPRPPVEFPKKDWIMLLTESLC